MEKAISPLDLWRLMGQGGKAKRVQTSQIPASDGLLAVFRGRITYTFIWGREVASIHFDQERGEIFFKGHNIRNLKLSEAHLKALRGLKDILKKDSRAKPHCQEYDATLARVLADNYKGYGEQKNPI